MKGKEEVNKSCFFSSRDTCDINQTLNNVKGRT